MSTDIIYQPQPARSLHRRPVRFELLPSRLLLVVSAYIITLAHRWQCDEKRYHRSDTSIIVNTCLGPWQL